jgi:chromosome partitioning protein
MLRSGGWESGMAVVITVAQQKGGAGKSTLVANLAAAMAAVRRVAILDIDPQHSLARWHAIRSARPASVPPGVPALAFSDLSGWRLAGELERLRREFDVVLIDSPPVIDTDARRAIRGADLVVVPVQPSPPDIWAAEGTLKLAAEEKRAACLVLNRVPTGKRLLDTTDQELRRRGLAALPAVLGNRAAFSHAFAEGLGVTEFAPRSQAAAELRALLAAILAVIE